MILFLQKLCDYFNIEEDKNIIQKIFGKYAYIFTFFPYLQNTIKKISNSKVIY